MAKVQESQSPVSNETAVAAPKAAPAPALAPAPAAAKVAPAAKPAKAPKAAKPAATEKKLEGLTKATVETGIITFNQGSGSALILRLVKKYGFDRAKVLAAAKTIKDAGKGFADCDPAKKYSKVAGIIKKLQAANYKMPE